MLAPISDAVLGAPSPSWAAFHANWGGVKVSLVPDKLENSCLVMVYQSSMVALMSV